MELLLAILTFISLFAGATLVGYIILRVFADV